MRTRQRGKFVNKNNNNKNGREKERMRGKVTTFNKLFVILCQVQSNIFLFFFSFFFPFILFQTAFDDILLLYRYFMAQIMC